MLAFYLLGLSLITGGWGYGKPDSHCVNIQCPVDTNRVCAKTHGSQQLATFDNSCEVQRYSCLTGQYWHILFEGPCECPVKCPTKCSPVCAAIGNTQKTFQNFCELLQYKCHSREPWKLLHNEACLGVEDQYSIGYEPHPQPYIVPYYALSYYPPPPFRPYDYQSQVYGQPIAVACKSPPIPYAVSQLQPYSVSISRYTLPTESSETLETTTATLVSTTNFEPTTDSSSVSPQETTSDATTETSVKSTEQSTSEATTNEITEPTINSTTPAYTTEASVSSTSDSKLISKMVAFKSATQRRQQPSTVTNNNTTPKAPTAGSTADNDLGSTTVPSDLSSTKGVPELLALSLTQEKTINDTASQTTNSTTEASPFTVLNSLNASTESQTSSLPTVATPSSSEPQEPSTQAAGSSASDSTTASSSLATETTTASHAHAPTTHATSSTSEVSDESTEATVSTTVPVPTTTAASLTTESKNSSTNDETFPELPDEEAKKVNQVIVEVSKKDGVQMVKINNRKTNQSPSYVFLFMNPNGSVNKVDVE